MRAQVFRIPPSDNLCRSGGFLQVWDYKEGRLLSTVDRSSIFSYFYHYYTITSLLFVQLLINHDYDDDDFGSHGTRLRRPCGLAVGGEGRHAYLVDMARFLCFYFMSK